MGKYVGLAIKKTRIIENVTYNDCKRADGLRATTRARAGSGLRTSGKAKYGAYRCSTLKRRVRLTKKIMS